MADRRKISTRRRSRPSTSTDPIPQANNLSRWISDKEKHHIILDDDIWTTVAQLQLDEDVVMLTHGLEAFNKILAFCSFLKNPKYKGIDVSTEAFQNTHPENEIGSYALYQMGFILQGNTYVPRDDGVNPKDEDDDQEIDDVQDEAGPSTPA
ncbi:hypothetical protein LR48_Vigan08g039100 [Vigna angularis]|uniref:Uncharacterized protein n=1 Tax=Phaseolus angularis TaxID=3914 RepID=A0A0L9V4D9_PHAAN|nr:hypothetical protein LR48_Vigan08g039100 [Vigna angularis]